MFASSTLSHSRLRTRTTLLACALCVTVVMALAGGATAAHAANGCGSATWYGKYVPDSPVTFNFHTSCNRHDNCYGTRWSRISFSYASAKLYCDRRFYGDMSRVCYTGYIGAPNIYRLCQNIAYAYYRAVRSSLGESAYRSAQRSAR